MTQRRQEKVATEIEWLQADLDDERAAHQVCVEMRDEAYAENARLRAAVADSKADALRLHQEKMVFFDALLEIKCGDELTSAECMAIATRALEQGASGTMTDDEIAVLVIEHNAGNSTPVRVTANDYAYDGWFAGALKKRSGAWRYVVEDVNGRLFIHNASQINRRPS